MRDVFTLPVKTRLGEREYDLHTDWRDILEIFTYLEDPDIPEYLRWQIAVALFYEQEVPPEDMQAAMQYLARFIAGGSGEKTKARKKLLDWQQDGTIIVAEVNRAAGQEIRALPYLHWWTFLGWFHTIGQGQLSMLVSIRDKLLSGKKLEPWEKEYYRDNKNQVDIPKRYSREEREQMQKLQLLLEGKGM